MSSRLDRLLDLLLKLGKVKALVPAAVLAAIGAAAAQWPALVSRIAIDTAVFQATVFALVLLLILVGLRPKLRLKLEPVSGFDRTAVIEVRNLGATASFFATGELLGVEQKGVDNRIALRSFGLTWSNAMDPVEIRNGGVQALTLGQAGVLPTDQDGHTFCELRLVGRGTLRGSRAENYRWPFGEEGPLSIYLRVTVAAASAPLPWFSPRRPATGTFAIEGVSTAACE